MKRRGAKKEKGCVEVVAVKSVVAVGSGWRLCLMRAEEWLAVYVWAIEREEVGRKMEMEKRITSPQLKQVTHAHIITRRGPSRARPAMKRLLFSRNRGHIQTLQPPVIHSR